MLKRTKIIVIVILIILMIIALAILFNSGYIFIEDMSSKEFIELKDMIKTQEVIDLKLLLTEEWETAIIMTNENEMEIVNKYKEKEIIDNDFRYGGLDPSYSQLSNILFLNKGKVVKQIVFDNRYFNIITKNAECIYYNDSNFKVQNEFKKTTIKQI